MILKNSEVQSLTYFKKDMRLLPIISHQITNYIYSKAAWMCRFVELCFINSENIISNKKHQLISALEHIHVHIYVCDLSTTARNHQFNIFYCISTL